MTFSVNGIKQEKNEKQNIEMLVCVDASLLARRILEEKNILILSIKEFPEDRTTFGDIYFTSIINAQETEIVTKYTDIQEACDFFVVLGFEITKIDRYSAPISKEAMVSIIDQAKLEAVAQKALVQQELKKKESAEKKVYQDDHLESAKKIIFRVFEKIDETTKRSDGQIAVQDMRRMKVLTEELRKLRMGTNLEKIRSTVQELFAMVEKINNERYTSIQNPSATILPESLVTTVDVDRELDRLENVKILKTLGAKIAINNQDYATLGSVAVFAKFLQKDFLYKIANLGGLLYSVYDIIEFIVVVIITLLGVYTIANELYRFSTSQYGLAFGLITMGIRGIVIYLARFVRSKSIGKLLIIIALAIVLHYVLMRVLQTNFAL